MKFCSKCSKKLHQSRGELCRDCRNHRLPPFLSTYNKLRNYITKRKELTFQLTFAEFEEFTRQPDCHYCGAPLPWTPYLNQARSNLDRKDNSKGYSKTNCVPCCRRCNTIKNQWFTYADMMLLSPILREIRQRTVLL